MKLSAILFCLMAGYGVSMAASNSVDPKTPRELMQYIEDAQKLGLRDDAIKQNAIKAGWDSTSVEQAFSLLSNPGKSGMTKVPIGYRIGAGDVLSVVVWKEPEASVPGVVVRADGNISVPLIKEIEVLGMTPNELEKTLTEKFSRYIRGADVTVIPKEIHSQKVYILGGVKKEGPLPLQSSLTVLQAIMEAGGLSEYAKPRKIYVLRKAEGKQVRLPFDYEAVIEGLRPEQNISLLPNDTIVVPR